MKYKKLTYILTSVVTLFAFSLSYAEDNRPEKPNIILILSDDFGQQDVACYDLDSKVMYDTPFFDSLAKEGVMFRQAYSPAPTCAPSRAAIISGLHPARSNLTHVSGGYVPHASKAKTSKTIMPYYRGHSVLVKDTLPKVLQDNGYFTGHAGKWHMGDPSVESALKSGFDVSSSERGVTHSSPDRSKIFATKEPGGKYQLGDDGWPIHENLNKAIGFMDQAGTTGKPFYLYWATFLVHSPIHSASRELLAKYCDKMGLPFPKDPNEIKMKGLDSQRNPYYGAMVEMLDHYCSKIYEYLLETDDPRWKGHKLYENTYLIFTSDNGGAYYTNNSPLKFGKSSAMEGGTRVPMFIVGPNIPKGIKSDVLVNGLDFYPTIMSWAKAKIPEDKILDGCDLSTLLEKDPTDSSLVKDKNNQARSTLFWHFPNASSQESAIRIGDYKLVRNYSMEPELELYKIFDSQKKENSDVGELNNLANQMPEKALEMNRILTETLADVDGRTPYINIDAATNASLAASSPSVLSYDLDNDANTVEFTIKNNGAKIDKIDLIYRTTEHLQHPWLILKGLKANGDKIKVILPENTTHFFLNIIDENACLVCYPSLSDGENFSYTNDLASSKAIRTSLAPSGEATPTTTNARVSKNPNKERGVKRKQRNEANHKK